MTEKDDYTMGDLWKAVKADKKKQRVEHGIDCPGCRKKEPKRSPTILLPQQRCRVCGYRDPRHKMRIEKDD